MTTVHPGALVAPLILEPAGISQSAFARRLGFNQPQPINELINGKRGFTSKMALLFEQVTEGRYPAEFWLLAQMRWDLAEAHSSLSPARKSMVDPAGISATAASAASTSGYTKDLLNLAKKLRQVSDTE
jgi:addiction module HigA family antidote